jgi:hypothetical protein
VDRRPGARRRRDRAIPGNAATERGGARRATSTTVDGAERGHEPPRHNRVRVEASIARTTLACAPRKQGVLRATLLRRSPWPSSERARLISGVRQLARESRSLGIRSARVPGSNQRTSRARETVSHQQRQDLVGTRTRARVHELARTERRGVTVLATAHLGRSGRSCRRRPALPAVFV